LRFNGYRPKAPKVKGYRAAFYPGVVVTHDNRSVRNTEYQWHRTGRFNDHRKIFIQKWGFEFV
jgi:hypothetical protein